MLILDGELIDNLVASHRFSSIDRNRFTEGPTTTEPEVDFAGRLWKTTDVEDSADDGSFGARQTTTEVFDLQKIEDD